MIQLTQEELWAFNILNSTVTNAQAEFDRSIQARTAYIGLLENKYSATFNQQSGQFELKEVAKAEEG